MLNENLINLTLPQKNILMRERYYSGTAINNLAFTFNMKKDLDEKLCEKTLNKIIEKNEGLRLRITSNESGTFQYVTKYTYETIPIIKNKTEDEVKQEIEEDANIPFIFEDSKLYKFVIYKLPNKETSIYIKLHHIISDAWATKILFKQFNQYYNAFLENDTNVLENSQPSYIDSITKEETYLNSNKFKSDKNFWEKYLTDLPEAIPFKEIATKKTIKTYRYTEEVLQSTQINEFCNKNKLTPFVFFVGVYAMYLYKSQSKCHFTIGTPLLNRKNRKEKDTIGVFVSTKPLKIDIDESQTFNDFIRNLSVTLFGFLRHESYPYKEMQNYVHGQDGSNSSLFDTIISYQNIRPDIENVDYEFKHAWNFNGSTQSSFELHITDYNGEGTYFLNLDYNENFCNNEEIKFVFNRFINIIKQILETPNIHIQDFSLLDKNELNLVENKFNNFTNYKPSKTLLESFESQVRKTPNNIAIKFENTELTYAELNKKVNAFAHNLLKNNISGNIPVSILVERSLEMVISMLAVLKVGAYYITIDPFWPQDRVSYIIKNSKSKTLITHKKYEKEHTNISTICIEDIDYNLSSKNLNIKPKMSDYAYVIYTSGSTGKPKGTMMTNTNVVNLLHSASQNFKQNENDVWTLFHTYTFDFSAWETYGCLTFGGKLIVVPKVTTTDPTKFLNLVIDEGVTILNQTPAYFYKVIDAEKLSKKTVKDIRFVILGGEAVFAKPLKYWKEKYPNIVIYNGYGPTETTIFAIMCEITNEDIENNNIFIGYPLKNYKIIIADNDLNPLGIGCEGEICIAGNGVCSGYFNNPKMTKEKFLTLKDGTPLYKSGDVGYWNLDGRIKYIGRNDHQVKIRGFRVELEEIEKELLACEDVSRAVVFPIKNKNYTKSLVGFIETDRENGYTEEVLSTIKKNLTSYMIPKLYQVKEFPINNNGKVDRRKLAENCNTKKENIILPKNKLQQEIYDIICKTKNIKDFSIKDDFFEELGLDSLDIMQVATYLSKYSVEVQKINNNPSVESLAKSISENKKDISYINELYDINVVNKKVDFDLSNVLLTGATGFLGVHILRELLENKKVKKVYCLIRKTNKQDSKNRLLKHLEAYFGNKTKNIDKIVAVTGDFEKPFLDLSMQDYFDLENQITAVIHCGANVRHFGNFKSFYQTNVIGTENIIKFAYDSNSSLAHISTVSVGGYSEISSHNLLDENTINVNQTFKNHVYMITKYEAECKVLDANNKGLINAKIFRLGNIMPRYKDGKFQINRSDNAFLSRLQTILQTNSIPQGYNNLEIDLSPVDLCAEAIVKLLKSSAVQTIYHIYNNNTIKVKKILHLLDADIEEVSIEKQIEKIKEKDDPHNGHLLNDLLNPTIIETKTTNITTVKALHKLRFKWNKINKKYLSYLIK